MKHYSISPFILFLSLIALSVFSSCESTEEAAKQPNIVLIITDDQGIGDLGVSKNPVIETPNIDLLASQSASMKRFYVSPVCAPTRANLMTGRYNYRTRAIDTYIGRAMMDAEENTLAELLGAGGYKTGLFGKWHLGDCYPMRPHDQGFQESLYHLGGGLAQPSEPLENGRRYTDPILFKNGEQVQTKGYCTDVYFDAALEYMQSSIAESKPFFTYIATNAPHGPYHDVPEDLRVKYMEKDLGPIMLDEKWEKTEQKDRVARVFAMIENIDQNVGKLLSKLEEWQIKDNTIVIFMVDNGPNSRRYVMDLRGMKSEVHEGGIRSPFYFHWPAQVKAGNSSEKIAAHIDITPTLLNAAGIEAPSNLDGKSILSLLKGEEITWEDRNLFIQTHRGDAAIKYHHFAAISQEWKLVHPTGFGREEMPEDVPYELYKIDQDTGEKENLYSPEHEKAQELMSAYESWFEDVSSTRPDNYAKPRIIIGTEYETSTHLTKQDWERLSGRGWGSQGKWYLEVANPMKFEVKGILTEPVEAKTAQLVVGDQTLKAEIPENETQFTFPEIDLPNGPLELKVILGDNEEQGPYQVVITQAAS